MSSARRVEGPDRRLLPVEAPLKQSILRRDHQVGDVDRKTEGAGLTPRGQLQLPDVPVLPVETGSHLHAVHADLRNAIGRIVGAAHRLKAGPVFFLLPREFVGVLVDRGADF